MLYYIPGCLPDFFPTTEPSLINWGKRNDGSTIVLSWSTIINAYNEIVRWEKCVSVIIRKNLTRLYRSSDVTH